MLIFPVYYYKDIYIYFKKCDEDHFCCLLPKMPRLSYGSIPPPPPPHPPNCDASMVLGKTQLVQRFKYVNSPIGSILTFFRPIYSSDLKIPI